MPELMENSFVYKICNFARVQKKFVYSWIRTVQIRCLTVLSHNFLKGLHNGTNDLTSRRITEATCLPTCTSSGSVEGRPSTDSALCVHSRVI